MNFSHYFIRRPIFAAVLSIAIFTMGLLALFRLPISEYPEVVPPTIVVRATYPGATPKTIAETVASPLEESINGVEGALYMFSQATGDGVLTLTVTFALGTDIDKAQVQVQNRVSQAEAKLPEERPRIASVFENRLRLGMKLDCDPTTIYAALLEARYRGAIYRSDLENSNPYNTYQHAGLPPGPIANPGLASIQAVLHPEASQALYFVLRPDGSGAHQFSENLAQQSAAIARYRRARSR